MKALLILALALSVAACATSSGGVPGVAQSGPYYFAEPNPPMVYGGGMR